MSWGCGGGDGRPLRASQALPCPGSPLARRCDKVTGALDIVSWLARKNSKAAEEAGPGPGSVNAPLNKEKLDKEKAEAILMPCASTAGQPCRCLTRAAFLCPLERPARGQRVPTPRAGLAATHSKHNSSLLPARVSRCWVGTHLCAEGPKATLCLSIICASKCHRSCLIKL